MVNYFDDIDISGLKDYVLVEVLDECTEATANKATPANTTAKNTMGMGNPKMPSEDGEGSEPLAQKKPKKKRSNHKKKLSEEE